MTTFTTEDRVQAEKIEDVTLDAQDAFYTFDEEQGNIFDDDDRMLFCEGYNQGVEAMRKQVLTLLARMAEEE
jgi:hypothetical protein